MDMEMRLEVVPIPVTDVDAAKAFYTERVGFRLDRDVRPSEGMRVVQLTPPGSACSVVLGEADPRRAGAVLDRVLESIRKPELSP